MAEHEGQTPESSTDEASPVDDQSQAGAATKPRPTKRPPQQLPPWKVLLHNDDTSAMEDVIESIVMLTPLTEQDATLRMQEAHDTGVALLLTTHRERAELYRDQFASRSLTVTIEQA